LAVAGFKSTVHEGVGVGVGAGGTEVGVGRTEQNPAQH